MPQNPKIEAWLSLRLMNKWPSSLRPNSGPNVSIFAANQGPQHLRKSQKANYGFSKRSWQDRYLEVLFVILFAVTEEILFRGALVRLFLSWMGSAGLWGATVVGSIFFAAGHFIYGPHQVICKALFSVSMYALLFVCQTIYAPLLAHVAFNGLYVYKKRFSR